jgi:hypothetical protein
MYACVPCVFTFCVQHLHYSTGQRMVERVSKLDTDIHSLEAVRDDAAQHKAAPPSDCEDPEREMLREIASYSPLLIQYIQGCIDFTDAQVCGAIHGCVVANLLFRLQYPHCHSHVASLYMPTQARVDSYLFVINAITARAVESNARVPVDS